MLTGCRIMELVNKLGGLQAMFLSQESCDPAGVGPEGSDLNPNPQASKPITLGPRELARSPKQTWHHKRRLTKTTVFQDECTSLFPAGVFVEPLQEIVV